MTTWGIHNDRAEIDPIADGAVRIGWEQMGDLSKLEASRNAFKAAVARHMPELDEGQIPSTAGTLYRFVHKLAVGDVVVSPNRQNQTLNIGEVSGSYNYRGESPYPHWRPITWMRTGVPRTELSKAASEELGSATTLFVVKTGAAEIAHLLAEPAPADTTDYTWTGFYPRLVDALLRYRDDRSTLLEKLWNVAQRSRRPELFKYLRNDQYDDGGRGPVRDIDPFTVLGTFNRGIREDARAEIVQAFGAEFDVPAPYPTTFPGVPIVNNLSSWFFRWESEREPGAIDALWALCEAAVEYASGASEATREQLVTAFDACATGNTGRLTMGLYWIRPDHFTAYDALNRALLRDVHPDLATTLALGSRLDGEQFLANTEAVASWLADPDTPFSTVAELSHAAWVYGAADSAPDDPSREPGQPDSSSDVELVGDSYDLESIRKDGAFVPVGTLETMLERLRAKKNIVLQGPPGTGKTWLARRLGWALCAEKGTSRVQVVQFHPSMAYEDFVRGWRPTGDGLKLADGPFLEICTAARQEPDKHHVLVIEEVNRGNPAQIFGELLTLLEADKRTPDHGMRLAYARDGEQFFVPPNVHIIGTMNLADRSLAIVDMALRRRFAFIELKPALNDDWADFVQGLGYEQELLQIYADRVRDLNQRITDDRALGRHYCIGHSYFTPSVRLEATGLSTREWWHRIIETDIRPLLEEYWFDRPEIAEEASRALLS